MDLQALDEQAQKKAAAMGTDQAKDGLNMGLDMFAGRVDAFLRDQAQATGMPLIELSLLISPFSDGKKPMIRYDLMRTEPESEIKHNSEHAPCEIMGLPKMMSYVFDRKIRTNILEAFTALAMDYNKPPYELKFHIQHDPRPEAEKVFNLKLLLLHNNQFIQELEIEKIINEIN